MASKVIIIGSGPAGLTAAIYSSRAQLSPIVFTGTQVGGQLINTTLVENFPGFPEGILGPELMARMVQQAENHGTTVLRSNVEKVDFSQPVKKIWSDGKLFEAESVIIATGASPRRLGVPGEDMFFGKGVSTCATCDGAFFKDKVVAVVGGGDTAMEEASFLTKFASKVYIIHRRDKFKAGPLMQERVTNNPKVEILWNSEVKEVLGDKTVIGLTVLNNLESKEETLAVDGMFLAIGNIPNSGFLKGEIEMDENGYVLSHDGTRTSVEGVFVAGEANDPNYKQVVTSAGIGCQAAMDVERWLMDKDHK